MDARTERQASGQTLPAVLDLSQRFELLLVLLRAMYIPVYLLVRFLHFQSYNLVPIWLGGSAWFACLVTYGLRFAPQRWRKLHDPAAAAVMVYDCIIALLAHPGVQLHLPDVLGEKPTSETAYQYWATSGFTIDMLFLQWLILYQVIFVVRGVPAMVALPFGIALYYGGLAYMQVPIRANDVMSFTSLVFLFVLVKAQLDRACATADRLFREAGEAAVNERTMRPEIEVAVQPQVAQMQAAIDEEVKPSISCGVSDGSPPPQQWLEAQEDVELCIDEDTHPTQQQQQQQKDQQQQKEQQQWRQQQKEQQQQQQQRREGRQPLSVAVAEVSLCAKPLRDPNAAGLPAAPGPPRGSLTGQDPVRPGRMKWSDVQQDASSSSSSDSSSGSSPGSVGAPELRLPTFKDTTATTKRQMPLSVVKTWNSETAEEPGCSFDTATTELEGVVPGLREHTVSHSFVHEPVASQCASCSTLVLASTAGTGSSCPSCQSSMLTPPLQELPRSAGDALRMSL